ncbi:tRNA(Glu)-specific nuclease WapA [Bacillus subtilis subsp. subtilis]|nr:tRNA(Glu)-specific nuclease WapA [Bacillus subtilis subsp. subtilis]
MYTFTKAYTYGDSGQLLAFTQNGKKYFYHYNAQGDVIAISDSTGKTVAKYQYDAWGNPTKTEASDEVKDNRYRYAGYQYDEETGLYYLMARYYEPRNGVFLSLDPDPGSDGDSLDQNGYAYGNNNPVMNVDPDGHWVWLVVNAGFAAYDGYKAYKSGKGWKGAAWAAASNFGPGKIFKGASRAYKFTKKAVKITGHTRHGLNQSIGRNGGRGVNLRAKLNAVRSPKKVIKQPNGATKYVGKKATVVLNKRGKVITAYGSSRAKGSKHVFHTHGKGKKSKRRR